MVYLPHWPVPNVKNAIVLGLERVYELLNRLGNPHLKLPPVVHVAGTNGKGSTIAYLKAIFEAAGLKVHRYTSPHLVHFNERIEVAGKQVTDGELYQLMEEVRLACEGLEATFFEATTAAAFLAFSRAKADVLLLETGMGGRLDATNVVDKPILSVITPISFDHVEYLGDTIAKIAGEKAGIIKRGCAVVCSWQMAEAHKVLGEQARAQEAPMYTCGAAWNFEISETGFNLVDQVDNVHLELPRPALPGIHQIVNAATAAACVHFELRHHFPLEIEHIVKGLQKVEWPARMQQIKSGVLHEMLPDGFELWLDGAHNTGGAQMVSATIAHLWSDRPVYIINGRTGNRDIKGFLEYFKGIAGAVVGVKVESEPSGEKAENIYTVAKEMGFKSYAASDLKDALQWIIADSKVPARILVVGSLFLAGDILKANK